MINRMDLYKKQGLDISKYEVKPYVFEDVVSMNINQWILDTIIKGIFTQILTCLIIAV